MNHKHKAQVLEVEDRINHDLTQLLQYSNDWHQPLNPLKTELVVYHKSVQCPKLQVKFDGIIIEQKKIFKYLRFSLDGKLSFRRLIDAQFLKLKKSFTIMKHIHNQFQSAISLNFKFFQAYVWPHMFMMSSIYCLFRCPTNDLHNHFKLPTLKDRFRMSLQKRITRTWPTRLLLAIQTTEKRFVHPLSRKALYKILPRRSSKQSAYNTLHVFSTNQGCQISWLFINVTFIKQYDGILSESLRKYTYFHCSSLIVHSISTKIT